MSTITSLSPKEELRAHDEVLYAWLELHIDLIPNFRRELDANERWSHAPEAVWSIVCSELENIPPYGLLHALNISTPVLSRPYRYTYTTMPGRSVSDVKSFIVTYPTIVWIYLLYNSGGSALRLLVYGDCLDFIDHNLKRLSMESRDKAMTMIWPKSLSVTIAREIKTKATARILHTHYPVFGRGIGIKSNRGSNYLGILAHSISIFYWINKIEQETSYKLGQESTEWFSLLCEVYSAEIVVCSSHQWNVLVWCATSYDDAATLKVLLALRPSCDIDINLFRPSSIGTNTTLSLGVVTLLYESGRCNFTEASIFNLSAILSPESIIYLADQGCHLLHTSDRIASYVCLRRTNKSGHSTAKILERLAVSPHLTEHVANAVGSSDVDILRLILDVRVDFRSDYFDELVAMGAKLGDSIFPYIKHLFSKGNYKTILTILKAPHFDHIERNPLWNDIFIAAASNTKAHAIVVALAEKTFVDSLTIVGVCNGLSHHSKFYKTLLPWSNS